MTTAPSGDHLLRRSPAEGRVPERTRPITAEKVVHVALNPDDELRNLQVALLYSLTSRRMDAQLFPPVPGERTPPTNANWFTMAQWAVLTVGRNMRSRDVPHRASVLPESLRKRLTPAILSLRASEDRAIAAALSFGQVMVLVSVYHALLDSPFADGEPIGPDPQIGEPYDTDDPVGPEPIDDEPAPSDVGPPLEHVLPEDDEPTIAVMSKRTVQNIDQMASQAVQEQEHAIVEEAAEDELQRRTVLELADRLGATVDDLTIEGKRSDFYRKVLERLARVAKHQTELQEAFALYAQATPEAQARARAEAGDDADEQVRSSVDLVFEANLRLAAIEQVILDEAITMVINHVPQYTADQLEGRIATFAERSLRVPRRIAQITTSRRLAEVTVMAREVWARVMTDQVMVLALPSETIRLGRDLPPRDWRKPFYCEALLELSPQAQAVFDSFDRSLGDGRGAGAGDWRRFDDRLNFVANLLRSRHSDESLFWQPFTDEDVAKIWEGSYPSRIGDPYEQAVRTPYYPAQLGSDLQGITHDCSAPMS